LILQIQKRKNKSLNKDRIETKSEDYKQKWTKNEPKTVETLKKKKKKKINDRFDDKMSLKTCQEATQTNI
jgi:hypothetical protein